MKENIFIGTYRWVKNILIYTSHHSNCKSDQPDYRENIASWPLSFLIPLAFMAVGEPDCIMFSLLLPWHPQRGQDEFRDKEDGFDAAENGEAGEKSHRSSNKPNCRLKGHFYVVIHLGKVEVEIHKYKHVQDHDPFHLIVGGAGKEDLNHCQRPMFDGCSWGWIVVKYWIEGNEYLGWPGSGRTWGFWQRSSCTPSTALWWPRICRGPHIPPVLCRQRQHRGQCSWSCSPGFRSFPSWRRRGLQGDKMGDPVKIIVILPPE